MSVAAPSAPRQCLRSHPHGDLRWHQHGAPGDVSRLLLRIDVHGLREWKFCRRVDRRRAPWQSLPSIRRESPSRECSSTCRTVCCRDGDRGGRRLIDDRPRAVSPEQLRAQIERRLHADAVEDETGAASTRDRLYPLGGVGGVPVVHESSAPSALAC